MSVLSNFIWGVADTLRGPHADAEYSSGTFVAALTVQR
ncbi:hypothetical protein CLV47_11370 [Antricoccus suffuscus]|uniref:Uncharacterized protein n=1 Tax=Antricoccus suffuscus TaxID=1629062 RepID=A0A2T0ZX13_9ACTN|nr:type I restriction-modification system subunit M N-terminal domain-containing protein [Antricoccus suffuscus]PRZ40905.1 hypothetical protein CLV47_11370 [Antricoccus suffuscus]